MNDTHGRDPVLDFFQARDRILVFYKFLLQIEDGVDDLKVVFDPVVYFLQQNFLLFQRASNRSVNPFAVRNVVGNRTDFRVPLRTFNRVQEQLQPTAILLFSCAKAPFKSLWSPSQRSVETVF